MNDIIYTADAHCDFLYYAYNDGFTLDAPDGGRQAITLSNLRRAESRLQFFAAWVDPDARRNCFEQAVSLISEYRYMLEQNNELTPLTKDFSPECDRIATILTVEGGEALNGSVDNVDVFYKLGVRAMTLTWNSTNELASPAMRRANKGLTKLGKSVVSEMNRVGMAVDLSHLSDAGIDDVLELSSLPVFASHSNAREVCPHPRSLCDRHIKEIAAGGGVVCVNYYPPQLTAEKTASIADIVRHIVHISEIGGIECAALGSDFDGMVKYPPDMKNPSCIKDLLAALSREGFTREQIKRIAYWNLHDYIVGFCE